MVTGRNLIIVLAIVAVFAGLHVLRKPDDEQLIKNQLSVLAEQATKQAGEQPMETITRAGKIAGLFADPCILKIENPGTEETLHHQEVLQRVTMARNVFSTLKVSFYDINVTVASSHQANVILTMRLLGQIDDESYTDTQEVEFDFSKPDKTWLISKVQLVEILEK